MEDVITPEELENLIGSANVELKSEIKKPSVSYNKRGSIKRLQISVSFKDYEIDRIDKMAELHSLSRSAVVSFIVSENLEDASNNPKKYFYK